MDHLVLLGRFEPLEVLSPDDSDLFITSLIIWASKTIFYRKNKQIKYFCGENFNTESKSEIQGIEILYAVISDWVICKLLQFFVWRPGLK